jgi:hypothetical protein
MLHLLVSAIAGSVLAFALGWDAFGWHALWLVPFGGAAFAVFVAMLTLPGG